MSSPGIILSLLPLCTSRYTESLGNKKQKKVSITKVGLWSLVSLGQNQSPQVPPRHLLGKKRGKLSNSRAQLKHFSHFSTLKQNDQVIILAGQCEYFYWVFFVCLMRRKGNLNQLALKFSSQADLRLFWGCFCVLFCFVFFLARKFYRSSEMYFT